jgi:hypothetical protein
VAGKGGQPFSLSHAYLFPTRQYSPSIGGLAGGSETFRAVLRCEAGDPAQTPDFRVWAWIYAPGGPRISLKIDLLDSTKQDEILFLILEFGSPGGLLAGSYTLHLLAEDQRTKTKAETTSQVRIH